MQHVLLWRAAALAATGLAVGFVAPGLAQPSGARHTKVSLVAETEGVKPGRPLTVAIRLVMDRGWHTYWRNPGDSGLPTRVKWTLPDGVTAGEILWPAPIRFATGPVVSYGYDHEVLLPVEIRVPASFTAPELRLAARVDWLECEEACLPGKADLALALPVRSNPSPGPDAAAISQARRRLPLKDAAWRVTAQAAAGAIRLEVVPPRGIAVGDAYLYPVTPRLIEYSKPQALQRTRGRLVLTLPLDPNGVNADRLAGVLVAEAGDRTRILDVDVPVATGAH